MLSVDACIQLGVYDPAAPEATQQWELLELLVELGATPEDLAEHRDGLAGLASVLVLRGGSAVSLHELATQTGLPVDEVRALARAAGLAEPGPDERSLSPQLAGLVDAVAAARELFGDEAVLGLVRVMGTAMARVADAMVSAFLVNVEPAARAADPVGLAVGRANADAARLLTVVTPALDTLLRQHLIAARRTYLADEADGTFEVQQLAVGFVDVVGSTALAAELSTAELGALLSELEAAAGAAVAAAGGRVVKLIGDEVLFTARDLPAAADVARRLAAVFDGVDGRPQVRAGVAHGRVLLRDGDVFGPVVALAARLVRAAEPGRVAVPTDLAEAAGLPAQPAGDRVLKGFDEPVAVSLLT